MKSLKQKIVIPVLLLSMIYFLLLSIFVYSEARKIIIKHVEEIAQDKVEKLATLVDDKIHEWKGEINLLASVDVVKNMDIKGLKEFVSDNEYSLSEFEFLFISDKTGKYFSTKGEGGDISFRKYFDKVMTGKTVVSEPVISMTTGNPVIIMAAPIKDDRGNIIGLIGGDVNLSDITDIVNAEKLGDTGYAYMINKEGLVMAHPKKEMILQYNDLKDESKSFVEIIRKMINREHGIGYYEFEGIKKISSYMPVKSTDWSIAMTTNYNEVTKGVLMLRNNILIIGAIVIVLISILLYFITNNLVKPINKLKGYMEIASTGDLTVCSDINSNDEIGVLSESFNILIKENKRLLEERIKYDKLKTEFFSNVSHELKTPLNIIFASTQLLLFTINDDEDFDTTKLNKHINMIKQNGYRLLRLVNNLIDITRIDSGFIKLNLKNENIVEVVENITLSTVEYAQSKSRTIIFDTNIEEKIMAFDSEKIERIILNLISNAIKFTKLEDEIQVNIYDKGENIVISVKDTGIGISEEKQKMIFEKFIQVHTLYNRSSEGSGIGLSIVKSLVEMNGGEIHVKSKCGEGTEFIIQLPVKLVSEEDEVQIDDFAQEKNVEKIQIEFSDIYE